MREIAGIDAPLPERLAHLMTDKERMVPVANDPTALESFIRTEIGKAGTGKGV
jgi:hypothetical protein